VKASQGQIQKRKALLGQMPDQANRFIHLLNNRNKEQLEELGIPNRTHYFRNQKGANKENFDAEFGEKMSRYAGGN